MKNERKLGAILSYVYIFLQTAGNLFLTPFLLNSLGAVDFSVYRLGLVIFSYLQFADFGLQNTTTRFYTYALTVKESAEKSSIIAFSFFAYIFVFLTVTCVSILLYKNLKFIFCGLTAYEISLLEDIFLVIWATATINILGKFFSSLIDSHEKFIFSQVTLTIQSLLRLLLLFLVISIFHSALAAMIVQSITAFLLVIIRILYCYKQKIITFCISPIKYEKIKIYVVFALSNFFVFILDKIFWESGSIILGIAGDSSLITIYAISASIYLAYGLLVKNLDSIFLPKITVMEASKLDKRYFSDFFISVGRLLMFIMWMVFLCFFFFGKQFITIWVGYEYSPAYTIILLIIGPYTISLIQSVGLMIMRVRQLYTHRVIICFFMNISVIIFSFFFLKQYGILGLALTIGGTILVGDFFLMNYYYAQVLKLDIKKFWSNIIEIMIKTTPIIIGTFIFRQFFTKGLVIEFIIQVSFFITTYTIFIYFCCFNYEEKQLILQGKTYLKSIYKKTLYKS